MKTKKEKFLEIPELGIKVAKEVSQIMTLKEAQKYCKKHRARILNAMEAGYIYDNDLIKEFCKEREWLEHYSKKSKEKGLGCSVVNFNWFSLDGHLSIDGGSHDEYEMDPSYGVRLVFPF